MLYESDITHIALWTIHFHPAKNSMIVTTMCSAVGKLPPPVGDLPGASMAKVRNPLEALYD